VIAVEHQFSSKPRYRINMVAEMIGVTAVNLRAWERRYGIPVPQRGNNSYRLYSDADVNVLRTMKTLCEAGHAPSNAAKLVHTELITKVASEPKPYLGLEQMKRELVNSAIEFDTKAMDVILAQSLSLESAWIIYQEVIEPALCTIGDLWEKDSSYLANEHLLSHASKSALAQSLKVLRPPNPRKRVLFACVTNELHDIPLYALAIRASHLGCLPIIIGANTPPHALKVAVDKIAPDLVILSSTTSLVCYESSFAAEMTESPLKLINETISMDELIHTLSEYKEACGSTPWLIGGQAETTWDTLPDEFADHISSQTESLDQLLK